MTMTQTEPKAFEWVYCPQEYGPDSLESYCPGGYHPVHLLDTFCNGRYEVVHKLGTGSYSTVWLARDNHADRYVALKIMRSKYSGTSNESRILRRLHDYRENNPGIQGGDAMPTLLDEFDFDGPNGCHKCLVSKFAGYSIRTSRDVSNQIWQFPLQVARAITAKAVLGVHFMHKAGVVHGDLHKANVMLQIPNIDHLSVDELYSKFSAPYKELVRRIDGKPLDSSAPAYTVLEINAWVRAEDVTESDTIITDFGEAYLADSGPPEELCTPLIYRPPESLLEIGTIGMPADIWTLALTLVETMGKSTLFEVFGGDKDDIMAEIVSALGQPPETWWKAWHKRHEFFNEDGTWLDEDVIDANNRFQDAFSRPLKDRIISRTKRDGNPLADDEIDALVAMLEGMLKYDPEERSMIEDVMRSEWMKKYGFPAIEAEEEKKRLKQVSPSKEPQDSTETLVAPCADLEISSGDPNVGTTEVEQLVDTSSHDTPTETSHDTPTETLHDISPARVSELQPISIETATTPSSIAQDPQEATIDPISNPTSDPSEDYQPSSTTVTDFDPSSNNEVNHKDDNNDEISRTENSVNTIAGPSSDPSKGYKAAETTPTDSTTIPNDEADHTDTSDDSLNSLFDGEIWSEPELTLDHV
ncbi:MAG: hypothetical protein Q9174_005101 [Haloplaca sp. 1 TL-2023]